VVSNWTGSAWTRALSEKFVYDGWNLLGALDGANNAIARSFLWGLDLSGSLQGAGGVGGLICFRQHSGSSAGSHFASYDGNGNVMALVDGKTGSTSARYEYDAFGQTIRASGMMAMLNPVRFSSKCVDDETDFAYYGYRYLHPNMGRWLSRDPLQEIAGLSLYSFLSNGGINAVDADGRILVTLKSKVVRNCGGFTVEFEFETQNPTVEGYLVQEIQVTTNDKTCDKPPQTITPTGPNHYWELWGPYPKSPEGQVISALDTSERNETWGSNGSGTFSGTIRFFPKSVTKELNEQNGGWKRGDGKTGPDNQLFTTIPPVWWNTPQTEPGASRSVSYDYKCCCPWRYNNVTTTPSQ